MVDYHFSISTAQIFQQRKADAPFGGSDHFGLANKMATNTIAVQFPCNGTGHIQQDSHNLWDDELL